MQRWTNIGAEEDPIAFFLRTILNPSRRKEVMGAGWIINVVVAEW